MKSVCSVNRKLHFIVFVTLLHGILSFNISAFGEEGGKCIEGDCYDGDGIYTYHDGRKYVGGFKDGKRHGQGTYTRANGDKYVGEFVDGKKHGHGILTWVDGRKYMGEFKGGKRHGRGTYIWADGSKYVGEFKDGKRHGHGTRTWPDAGKYEGEYIDGKEAGGWYYQLNGKKRWAYKDSQGEWVTSKKRPR